VQKEAKPVNRRVYINQRILRLRDEVKGLQKELKDAQAGLPADPAAPKGAKPNHIKIYARERLVVLRDELKNLTAERKTLPQKPALPLKPASAPMKPASAQKPAAAPAR
jgi:hypothetical protein